MPDHGDPEDIRQVKTRQELLALDKAEAVGHLLDSYGGRAWLWDMLAHCQIYSDALFCGEDTHRTAFNAGRRSAGLALLTEIMAVRPNAYVRMQVEADERAKHIDLIGDDDGDGE